jgi:hypothetical protein
MTVSFTVCYHYQRIPIGNLHTDCVCFHAYFVSSGGMHDVHQPYCPSWPHDEEDGTEDQLLVQKWTVADTGGRPHDALHHSYAGGPHVHRCAVCHSRLCHARETMLPKAPFFWPQMLKRALAHWHTHTHTHASSGQTRTKNWWHTTTDLLSSSRRTITHINACTITK